MVCLNTDLPQIKTNTQPRKPKSKPSYVSAITNAVRGPVALTLLVIAVSIAAVTTVIIFSLLVVTAAVCLVVSAAGSLFVIAFGLPGLVIAPGSGKIIEDSIREVQPQELADDPEDHDPKYTSY